MISKKIMIIGPKSSGKTSLANILNNEKRDLKCSQDVIYRLSTIDVPSNYIESPWMHKHLITISQQANILVMLNDASNFKNIYPPNFSKVFNCPVIGVINKLDLLEDENIIDYFNQIDLDRLFKISIKTKVNFNELETYLEPYRSI